MNAFKNGPTRMRTFIKMDLNSLYIIYLDFQSLHDILTLNYVLAFLYLLFKFNSLTVFSYRL